MGGVRLAGHAAVQFDALGYGVIAPQELAL